MNLASLSVLWLVAVAVAETGLSFSPNPSDDNSGRTLIWYKSSKQEDVKHYKESLDHFLAPYKIPGITTGRGQNIQKCDFDQLPGKGNVCDVDIRDFGQCTSENNYGYDKNTPCIFFKLNKINGWKPDYYNRSDELPNNFPDYLREHVKYRELYPNKTFKAIWVSCEGENAADVENIGPLMFFPGTGFPGYYYPYENTEGYLEPLIAVFFENPAKGVSINIECKAWAKNLQHGSVHFELMID